MATIDYRGTRAQPADLRNFLSDEELVTPQERKKLGELNEEHRRLIGQIQKFHHDAAKSDIRAAEKQYLENPTDENLAEFERLKGVKHELKERYQSLRSSAKKALHKHSAETLAPAVEPILRRALAVTTQRKEALEASERDLAERLGVPYGASGNVRSLEAAISNLETAIANLSRVGSSDASRLLRSVVTLD